MNKLSPMRQKILDYVTAYTRENGYPPTVREICDQVRGLAPDPGAFAFCGGKNVKILAAQPADGVEDAPCGTVTDPKRLVVRAADGGVRLTLVQPEGKKPMSGESFCMGNRAHRFES